MKKVLLIASITSALLLTSCGKEQESGDNSYAIETSINGIPDGIRAFLKVQNGKGVPVAKDTAIVQNGKFTFYGTSEFPEMGFIYINGANGYATVILEKGNVKIESDKINLAKSIVSGGKHNQEYVAFVKNSDELATKIRSINQRYAAVAKEKDTASMNLLKQQADDLDKKGTDYQKNYIKEHPDSFISIQLVNRMVDYKIMKPQEAVAFYNNLSESMKKTRVAKDLNIKVVGMQRAAIGSIASNFTAPNPEGKKISLYDIRGKVTIIDFWAAWCGPCRRENPNVVNIYNKYHADGLEIIGVSLDGRQGQRDAKGSWIKAIEQDGLPWHHVSNLDGFRDGIARTYNVRSIPATFILNEKGEIVAKNLRGAQLEAKVKELLGK